MGDDTIIIVPPVEPEPEPLEEDFDHERVGQELLDLIDSLTTRCEDLDARIAQLEEQINGLSAREYAAVDHTHDGYAGTDHTHEGYSPLEHEHKREHKEPDQPPESQHFYFKRLGD